MYSRIALAAVSLPVLLMLWIASASVASAQTLGISTSTSTSASPTSTTTSTSTKTSTSVSPSTRPLTSTASQTVQLLTGTVSQVVIPAIGGAVNVVSQALLATVSNLARTADWLSAAVTGALLPQPGPGASPAATPQFAAEQPRISSGQAMGSSPVEAGGVVRTAAGVVVESEGTSATASTTPSRAGLEAEHELDDPANVLTAEALSLTTGQPLMPVVSAVGPAMALRPDPALPRGSSSDPASQSPQQMPPLGGTAGSSSLSYASSSPASGASSALNADNETLSLIWRALQRSAPLLPPSLVLSSFFPPG